MATLAENFILETGDFPFPPFLHQATPPYLPGTFFDPPY